jgi:NHL repeat
MRALRLSTAWPSYPGQSQLALGHRGRPRRHLYIADTENNRIRRVDKNGTVTTVAGTGEDGFTSDEVIATDAALHGPQAVAVHPDGTLYIADTGNNRIHPRRHRRHHHHRGRHRLMATTAMVAQPPMQA